MDNRKITDLPERTRRIILWVSVAALSIVIAAAWLWWLPRNLARLQPAKEDGMELQDLRQEIQNLIEQTTKQFEAAAAADEQNRVVEAMKNKLNEQKTTTTSSSTPIN